MTNSAGCFCANMLLAFLFLMFMQTALSAKEDAYAQKEDSLLILLEISPDRVKSKIYGELSNLALENDTALSKAYALQALEYAEMFQAGFDLSQSHLRLGRILFFQDSLEVALGHIKKSLAISHDSEREGETGRAFLNLSGKSLFYKANIYHQLYPDSAKIILADLLTALEKLNNSTHYMILADIHQMIGQKYFAIHIFDKGLLHFQKALDYYKMLDDKNNMAKVYMQMSYRVDRATGIDYAQRAIELFAEGGDSVQIARNLIHISYNARNILDENMNLKYLERALEIYRK